MRWTEAEMEQWLVPETRDLKVRGKPSIELTQSKLFWQHFDHLVDNRFFTIEKLIEFAHESETRNQLPFSLAIQDTVGHLYKSWHCE